MTAVLITAPIARTICVALLPLTALACLACGGQASPSPTTQSAAQPAAAAASVDPVQETVAWRAKHEADYRREWSTIAGLYFLERGTHTAGSDPSTDIALPASVPPLIGRFVLNGTTVRFEPQPGVPVTLAGQPVTAPLNLKDDGQPNPDELTVGSVKMAIHLSGNRRTLRVWDPNGPLAQDFRGFSWFDIQPEYRVAGRFIKDPMPRSLRVVNTFGDFDEYKTEGVVEFTLNGRALRLRPFTTRPNRFYFVFRDGSSGEETYEAARFLYADLRPDGTTTLDFNQAYNPPCAFNPYTTCPIPLPENRLPVKILAGEKAYPVHVALPGS